MPRANGSSLAVALAALAVALLAGGGAVAAAGPVRGGVAERPLVADPTSIAITVAAPADLGEVDAMATAAGLVRLGAIPRLGIAQYRPASGMSARTAAAVLRGVSGVTSAAPVAWYHALADPAVPNDPYFVDEWGLPAIGLPQAWSVSRGQGVIVAVLDTGVDVTHEDLAGQTVPGWDFIDGDGLPADTNGHGTAVAGIIAAATGNGIGMASVAPGARIMPVRVLDAIGNGVDPVIAQGITWAVDHGARVINLSLGGEGWTDVLQVAIDDAIARGAVVVAAAGNSGAGSPVEYPAAYGPVLAVGALGIAGSRASFSSTGDGLDIMAPGESILSTRPGTYARGTGTSFAVPFASAAVALVIAAGGQATRLTETARDLGEPGFDTYTGYGALDLTAALDGLVPVPSASPGVSPSPSPSASPGVSPSPSPSASPGVSPSPSPSASPGDDGRPPTVSIRGILGGTVVRGTRDVTASASDPGGVTSLQLLRGATPTARSSGSPLRVHWATTGRRDGIASWEARAVDTAGDAGRAVVRVLVANDRATAAYRSTFSIGTDRTIVRRSIRVAAASQLVARAAGAPAASVRLVLLDARGRLVAAGSGAASSWIAVSLRAGLYTLETRLVSGSGPVRLSADWLR
jgi:subtilisin family serine protease